MKKDGDTDPAEMETMQSCTRINFFFRVYGLNYCSTFTYQSAPESQRARPGHNHNMMGHPCTRWVLVSISRLVKQKPGFGNIQIR